MDFQLAQVNEITRLTEALRGWQENVGIAWFAVILLIIAITIGGIAATIFLVRWGKPSVENVGIFIKSMTDAYEKSAASQIEMTLLQRQIGNSQQEIGAAILAHSRLMTALREDIRSVSLTVSREHREINDHFDRVVVGISDSTADKVIERLKPILEKLDGLSQKNEANHEELIRQISEMKAELISALAQTIELKVERTPDLTPDGLVVEGTA